MGRAPAAGDLVIIRTARNKAIDVELFDSGVVKNLPENSILFKAEGVGHDGKNLIYTKVPKETLESMKLTEADEAGRVATAERIENAEEIAGKREGRGEQSRTKSFSEQSQDISQFNFNKHMRNLIGPPPINMVDPHAHHILFKEGNGAAQKELVREGQALLQRYGIDPVFGKENLVWAPNRIAGQHDYAALKYVVDQLKEVERYGGDYDDIVRKLIELGLIAKTRRK